MGTGAFIIGMGGDTPCSGTNVKYVIGTLPLDLLVTLGVNFATAGNTPVYLDDVVVTVEWSCGERTGRRGWQCVE